MSEEVVQLLRSRGKLDDATVARVRGLEEASGEPLHRILSRLGFVTELDLAQAFADMTGAPIARETDYPAVPLLHGRLGVTFLRAAQVVPLREAADRIVVAMADPSDRDTRRAIELRLGKAVEAWVALPAEIERQLTRLYGATVVSADRGSDVSATDLVRLREAATDEPVVRHVQQMIEHAVHWRASDIHLEPTEGGLRLRHRIDGVLRDAASPPSALHSAILSRIKIIAGLDIIERKLPQDGRSRVTVDGRPIDIRVSCVPTVHGESIALRILDKAAAPLDLLRLGLAADIQGSLAMLLDRPSGMVLVTGPTGSGKTTTLYASLQRLNRPERKLITVEDPVEYDLSGVHQIQVRPSAGLGFAQLLRSILRHDPDVIMVGEIRDRETAEMAIQAALTGHLVLSTLHTNDAASAIARLADMGIEPYLITSTLRAVVAQRLVRRLCRHCREADPEATAALRALGGVGTAYRARGCDHCAGSGYVGRFAIAEMLTLSAALRGVILTRPDAPTLDRAAQAGGMRPMRRDGLDKVGSGETALDEVLRVTQVA